jgi:hypothetical protein
MDKVGAKSRLLWASLAILYRSVKAKNRAVKDAVTVGS